MKRRQFFLRFVAASLLAVLVLTSTSLPHAAAAPKKQNVSFLQITGGVIVKQDGTRAYLDGLNYKDQFKSRLSEDISGTSDWAGIRNDFRQMASLGAKTIRVWFNWIYYEPTIGKLDSSRMISHMHQIVDIAKANRVYVIIVIYNKIVWNRGTPVNNWLQARTTTAKTDPGDANFWLNDGDFPGQQRSLFVNLWTKISSGFKTEPTVAAYDLINEPYVKYYDQQPSWTRSLTDSDPHYPLKSLYDLVLNSLRANGDNHIVILDYTCPEVNSYQLAALARSSSDAQVLYDIHFYTTAAENQVQGWDSTQKLTGPWTGKNSDGTQVSFTYPDATSAHDGAALRSRFELLSNAQLNGYLFFVGEFGFTENASYNSDVAGLAVEFGIAGFMYFEFVPDEPLGAVQVVAPVMSFVR